MVPGATYSSPVLLPQSICCQFTSHRGLMIRRETVILQKKYLISLCFSLRTNATYPFEYVESPVGHM